MKRGIIMELRDGRAVLMDGSGDIASVPTQSHWRVGDTAEFPRKQNQAVRWGTLAAALMLVLGGGLFAGAYASPYSLISLDVNPSVELTLNRFDRVISMRAMNDEGEVLLQTAQVKNQSLENALATLLGDDYLAGYLSADAYVTMTVQAGDSAREQTLLTQMDSAADAQIRANYQSAQVESLPVNSATVASAHGCGVTAGKYLALMALQEADPTVDITEYAHCGIGEIKTETQLCYQHAAQGGGHGNGNGGNGHQHRGGMHRD